MTAKRPHTPLSLYSRILLAADGQFRIEAVFSGSYDLSLKSNSANIEQFLSKIDVVGKTLACLKIDYLLPSQVIGQVLIVPERENVTAIVQESKYSEADPPPTASHVMVAI